MNGTRYLLVTADDFGIGMPTTLGILDLAARELVTSTVLLVNSPHAVAAVRAYHKAGVPLELGWHPCLTLDRPVLPPHQVPSLVGPDGCFWPLSAFMRRLCLGRIHVADIEAELLAQYALFCDLAGHPPTVVNSHHHVQVLQPVGAVLLHVLEKCRPLPYVRRVREPWMMLARLPGARGKRAFLSLLGRRGARLQERRGFPGNDWLAGITNPKCVSDANFLARWLSRVPGRIVELTCHPGYLDMTLLGRDCTPTDGYLQRRVIELHLLQHESFREACRRAGFTLVAPSGLAQIRHARAA